MSTDTTTKIRKKAGRFTGEGFPAVDDELEAAAGEYTKAMKKETDAKSAKKLKLENLIDLMKAKGVTEYRVTVGSVEKMVRLDSKDSIKIETVKTSKDSDETPSDE